MDAWIYRCVLTNAKIDLMCRDLPRIKYTKTDSSDGKKKGKDGKPVITEKDEEFRKVERMNNDILENIRKAKAKREMAAKGIAEGSEKVSLTGLMQGAEI